MNKPDVGVNAGEQGLETAFCSTTVKISMCRRRRLLVNP